MPRPTDLLTGPRDAVWRPTPGSMRGLALAALAANAGIVLTGGVVRLTGSGLGCPAFPRCTGDSFVPRPGPEHSATAMAIEFGNRLLTFCVLAAAVAVTVAALRQVPRRPALVRLAVLQPVGVCVQALLGGVTVLTRLHPATVAAHYLLSAGMVALALLLYVRAGEGDRRPVPLAGPGVRTLAAALVAGMAAVLVLGTLVTGSGPHGGDAASPRFGFEIEAVTRLHSGTLWATLAVAVALLVALRAGAAPELSAARRRVVELLAVALLQGAVGYAQYFTGVPAPLVAVHLFGSVVVWAAALRVPLALRDRGPATTAPPDALHSAPPPRTQKIYG